MLAINLPSRWPAKARLTPSTGAHKSRRVIEKCALILPSSTNHQRGKREAELGLQLSRHKLNCWSRGGEASSAVELSLGTRRNSLIHHLGAISCSYHSKPWQAHYALKMSPCRKTGAGWKAYPSASWFCWHKPWQSSRHNESRYAELKSCERARRLCPAQVHTCAYCKIFRSAPRR